MELNIEIFEELVKAYKEGRSKFIEQFSKLSLEEKVKLFVHKSDLVIEFLNKNRYSLKFSTLKFNNLFWKYNN